MHRLPDSVASLLQANEEALLLSDSGGRILFATPAAHELFGYAAGELVGKAVEVLVPAAQQAAHEKLRARFADRPRTRPLMSGLELTAQRSDGSEFRAEIALSPIHTESGLFVASTIREVLDRPTASDFFRTILDSAPDAMILADENGHIVIVNGQAERMFGYDRTELVGEPVELLLPESLHEQHRRHRATFAAAPSVRVMGAGLTLTARRKDGSVFPVEISLSPVHAAGARYVSTVIRDITERKQLEDEIEAARREAERANKANSAFLAAASHDLRQPVQALTLLNGALRRLVQDEKARGLIDNQQQSLQAMTNLLNSLLDISRLDAGAIAPDVGPFAVQRLFDRLASEFGRQAQQKGLAFEALPCDAVIRSDPNLLGEIIQNFVSNAIRYTGEGRVELRGVVEDGLCRLSVSDTGIGIDAGEIDRIFDEFHQAGQRGSEGFGLGLAIVRRLADLLGHAVDVTSTPGKGSCFTVSVPVVAPGDGRRPTAPPAPRDDARAQSGLILVIEDDEAVSAALEAILESDGFRVRLCRSADEVRHTLGALSELPVLIVSDFHVGDDVTGADLIRDVRSRFNATIPALIVSGDTSRIIKEARNLANCELLSKPVDPDQLLQAIAAAIDPPSSGAHDDGAGT